MNPPEKVVRVLLLRGLFESADRTPLGVHSSKDVAHDAVFARPVDALKDNEQSMALLGPHPVLEVVQPVRDAGELAFCGFLREMLAVVARVEVFQADFLPGLHCEPFAVSLRHWSPELHAFSICSFSMGRLGEFISSGRLLRRNVMKKLRQAVALAIMAVGIGVLSACSSGGGAMNQPSNLNPIINGTGRPLAAASSSVIDTDSSTDADLQRDEDGNSALKRLDDETTIGSAVDPNTGDQNPYGLDIAKADNDKIEAGDLVVCDFNDAANVQGTGTAIIALHPTPGSSPRHILDNNALDGCDEVALAPDDTIWASAFSANDNPIVAPDGTLLTTLAGGPWHGPFGQAFAQHSGKFGVAAFYESNATDGSIVRIGIRSNGTFDFETIATGFAVNGGVPGSILGPSGLQYDRKHDRLYIVDGTNNTLVVFRHVSTIPAHGITVSGTTFGGPFAHRARLIFSGAPLNGPISSALLSDGHLVLGNTLDPSGKNLMVEITPAGHLLDVKNVDTGAAGAIFGMVASSGNDRDDIKLYFNDDNDNTVKVLTR